MTNFVLKTARMKKKKKGGASVLVVFVDVNLHNINLSRGMQKVRVLVSRLYIGSLFIDFSCSKFNNLCIGPLT